MNETTLATVNPGQPLADGEPGFLLRASDPLAVMILREYANQHAYMGHSTDETKTFLRDLITAFHQWERTHPDIIHYFTLKSPNEDNDKRD